MIVGILGGGQLGMMLGEAAAELDITCRFLEQADDPPAARTGEVIQGAYDDPDALTRFAQGADIATYEFENVPVAAASSLGIPVYPPVRALETGQDRLAEKTFFRELGIPVPAFFPVHDTLSLRAALEETGYPAVLKTRREGYDGKGQYVLRDAQDIESAWEVMHGRDAIVESFVPFDGEVSIIAVRGKTGETAFYPLTRNTHREGILRLSVAPAGIDDALQKTAEDYATRALDALEYVGVLTLELFMAGGTLLLNEMAPRVHNSGHWTIEGAETSQFANHLRAVCGLPLGSTDVRGHAAMLNLIGDIPDLSVIETLPDTHIHLYGKSPRSGRKLGHITVVCTSADERDARVDEIQRMLDAPCSAK